MSQIKADALGMCFRALMHRKHQAGRLVIVDDDPHVLNALRFAFEIDGYEVSAYGAGEQILTLAPAGTTCVIIDENLPGVSGMQTAALLRARGVSVPIILITTAPSHLLRARSRELNVEIVEKPLVTNALAHKVSAIAAR